LVTSGPGATNAVTGLVDALMDSIPVVCLTGQVATHLIGNDAFQEADTTGITRPCTKHNYLVKAVGDLARTVHEAFYVARSGRPGPVVIDLPKDVLMNKHDYTAPKKPVQHKSYRPQVKPDPKKVEEAIELIAGAKRPIFYAGGGIVNAGPKASKLLTQFVHMTGYPVTNTLMGLGTFPASDPQFLGMLGMHGTYEANLAMYHCDVMINIGVRFDLPIVGDAGHVLEDMIRVWKAKQPAVDLKALKAWWVEIDKWRARNCLAYKADKETIKPQYALERLYHHIKDRDHYITTEVGQHQMWAAQFLKFEQPNRWMTSGGLGTMGYGFPAAMGVQIAHPDALVIDVAGEASIMMNIQELSTVAQYRLPVKIFILNNQYMGMVRQWQEFFHGGRYSESYMESLPDFVKLAEAFGAVGLRCHEPSKLDDTIKQMIDIKKPVVVDVLVDKAENCFPMIPSGAAHYDMLLGPDDRAAKPVSEEGMVLV